MSIADPEAVLAFWFGDDVVALETPEALGPRVAVWFAPDPAFDARIRDRFADLPGRAWAGEFDAWRDDARATLALVLILDQFPRNLYRGQAESFAFDPLAYEVAVGAIARGFDAQVSPIEAMFLYLPLEHAEDADAQNRCVTLIDGLIGRCTAALQPQFESFRSYAVRHRDVIERFGRFPHRNALLGRAATTEEVAYLEAGGETF